MTTNSLIILFLDGVGLGEADPERNPFMQADMPHMEQLLSLPRLTRQAAGTVTERAALLGLDTRLNVDGLPQSATGQTAILTGLNAPERLGRHYGPYPNQPLREMLSQHSLFETLSRTGQPAAYANAYPRHFLDRLKRGKGRLSANTLAAFMAGVELRGGEELRRGRAVSAFLVNDAWPEPDLPLPQITPYQAGQNLANLARRYRLTFFEFWYPDFLGHKQKRSESVETLTRLDQFLAGVMAAITSRMMLLVVSDHGNFEDWTTSKHTTNPALTILAGAGFEPFVSQLHSLLDIKPVALAYLSDCG